MKKSLLNTGLISFVVGFLIFVGYVNFANAEITMTESRLIVTASSSDWNSLSSVEQSAKMNAYRQAANAGMTHEQALGEANYVYSNLPGDGTSGDIVSSVQNTGWKYFEDGAFVLTKAPTFIPDVAEGDRTYQKIIGQLEDSSNQDVVWPLPLDADGNPDASMVDTGTATTTTPMLEITDARRIPVNTESGGTTNCGSEGLEGVDFLVFHGPLVPCGVKKTCADSSGKTGELSINEPCTLCHFIILAKNVFDLLLSMIIIVSLFMLTAAGVLYIVSSGGSMVSMAKGIIEKTLFGFGIFILGWLIVYTLLNMLSVDEKFIGKGTESTWFQFECDTKSVFGENPTTTTPNTNPVTTTPNTNPVTTTPNTNPVITTPNTTTEEVAREQLSVDSNGGISVWESRPGATDVRNIREETRAGILAFQRDAGVDVIITGGAESGPHAVGEQSHSNGYKIDIEDSSSVNNYIESSYQNIGNRAGDGGAVYSDDSGNYYVRERSHWDVCYNCAQPPLV